MYVSTQEPLTDDNENIQLTSVSDALELHGVLCENGWYFLISITILPPRQISQPTSFEKVIQVNKINKYYCSTKVLHHTVTHMICDLSITYNFAHEYTRLPPFL